MPLMQLSKECLITFNVPEPILRDRTSEKYELDTQASIASIFTKNNVC